MSPPIGAGHPLVMQQRVEAMGGSGKRPFDPEIRAKPNDENALPPLRDAKIRRVHQRRLNVINQGPAAIPPRGLLDLQTAAMILPILAFPPADFGNSSCERMYWK